MPAAVIEFLVRTGELRRPFQHYVDRGVKLGCEVSGSGSFVPLTPGVSDDGEEDNAGFV